MGREYFITLENKAYGEAVSALAAAFRKFPVNDATLVENETWFALMGDDPGWPEQMQISIETANENTGVVPAGEPYLYCLFYIGGDEAHRAIERIRTVLDGLGPHVMDDL